MDRKFSPSYPKLFAAEGQRCPKLKVRGHGLVTLQCVRRVHGAEVNHLMDVMDRDAVEGSTFQPVEDELTTANLDAQASLRDDPIEERAGLTPADMEALANAWLLSVAPGTITRIEALPDGTIEVDSQLSSVFAGYGPSQWLTTLSRVDGRVLDIVVTKKSELILDTSSPRVVVDAMQAADEGFDRIAGVPFDRS